MNNRSIRFRIIVWFIAVLLIMLATSFVVFFFIGEKVSRDTAKEDVREMVAVNMDEIQFREGDPPKANDASTPHYAIKYEDGYLEVDDFVDLIVGVACGIYDSEGRLLYGLNYLPNETKNIGFADSTVREVESDKGTFYILDRRMSIEGRDDIWIRGMVDRAHDRDQTYRMYRIYVTFIPLMMLLAALVVYFVTRSALSPLNHIVEEVGRIKWGSDLKQRINVKAKDYEISIIVDALNNMLTRLQESYEVGRRFTSNVSHDLRTPVSIILAQTELALEEETDEETREAFKSIHKQGVRTKEILDGLLTYMRLEDMSEVYEMKDMDLSENIRNTCDSFRVLDDKNITMEESIEEGIYIKGNAALIRGLLENLLTNAYKYSKENGHVKVTLESDSEEVRLSVRDDGIGISEDDLEKIFEWMYRTEASKSIEGSGIGLYVVRQVAELHGGEVRVESKPGVGSTFTVAFAKPTDEHGDIA